MVTWKRDPSHSRPHRQQDSSPAASDTPDHDQRSGSSEALHEAVDLVQTAEAALAPGKVGQSPADAARRLQADLLMVEAVLEEGLGGPRHRKLQEELIRYGVPVLRQLLFDGRIISKCKQLGRPLNDTQAWLEFTEADRDELARDMVADGEPVFTMAVFRTRTWSADWHDGQAASLKTYFVNACVLQFPALYGKWLRQRRVSPAGLQVDAGGPETVRDISGTVDLNDEVRRLLRSIPDPKVREVLALRAIGYTAAEAARRVGLTEKAAEGRLARMRKALRKKPELGPVTGDGTPAMEGGGCSDTQQA
jgi:hypothetical protein